jgi:glycosyltransferase involved in cell wall biosynthesis
MTYNHEDYISQAIESALMQKTTFDFEIIIGEDISSDNTRKICRDYANAYPAKIRLLNDKVNFGMVPNFVRTLKQCKGRYIALLEGDDYWIDPLKLQKQMDILENSKYSLVFHNAFTYYQQKIHPPKIFCERSQQSEISFEDVVMRWQMPTASIIFDREKLILPPWFTNVKNWDWVIQILLTRNGKAKYIDEVMSVYRKHEGGNSFNPDYNDINTHKNKLDIMKHLLSENIPKEQAILKSKQKSLTTKFNEISNPGIIRNLRKNIKYQLAKRGLYLIRY